MIKVLEVPIMYFDGVEEHFNFIYIINSGVNFKLLEKGLIP